MSFDILPSSVIAKIIDICDIVKVITVCKQFYHAANNYSKLYSCMKGQRVFSYLINRMSEHVFDNDIILNFCENYVIRRDFDDRMIFYAYAIELNHSLFLKIHDMMQWPIGTKMFERQSFKNFNTQNMKFLVTKQDINSIYIRLAVFSILDREQIKTISFILTKNMSDKIRRSIYLVLKTVEQYEIVRSYTEYNEIELLRFVRGDIFNYLLNKYKDDMNVLLDLCVDMAVQNIWEKVKRILELLKISRLPYSRLDARFHIIAQRASICGYDNILTTIFNKFIDK